MKRFYQEQGSTRRLVRETAPKTDRLWRVYPRSEAEDVIVAVQPSQSSMKSSSQTELRIHLKSLSGCVFFFSGGPKIFQF